MAWAAWVGSGVSSITALEHMFPVNEGPGTRPLQSVQAVHKDTHLGPGAAQAEPVDEVLNFKYQVL